jgi:hypothetical protein
MLKSGLRVYCYVGPPLYTPYLIQDVSEQVDDINFSSVAPGGFGDLSMTVKLANVRLPQPQFSLFAHVAVMQGATCLWLGEITNPAFGMDSSNGEYVKVQALGLGNCLRDDPSTWSYTNSTAQAVAIAQLNWRTVHFHEIPIDTDTSQLFPDNPATLLNLVYDGRNIEEIITDVALQVGDYNWGVEAHPINKDFTGVVPTGRLFARKRDTTTTHYTAYLKDGDIYQYEFTPTADMAYNAMDAAYTNGAGGVTHYITQDARLGADLSQSNAPFRWRKYQRDFTGISTIGATQAQQIANTQLALYKNVTYKASLSLRRVRDANHVIQDLTNVQAGKNIFIPELAVLGSRLASSATPNVNQFYIKSAKYSESQSGEQQMQLDLGYYRDDAAIRIAQLQLAADAQQRGGKTTGAVQALGAPINGFVSWDFSNGTAGQNTGVGAQFPAICSQTPTSLTLTGVTSANIGAPSAASFTNVGCRVFGVVAANGSGDYAGTYATVGNCLKDLNVAAGRFAWHCDVCDQVFADLAVGDHLRVNTGYGITPGRSALSIVCPGCAAHGREVVEAFNTALTFADETNDHYHHRAEQARLIRAVMAHPQVALRRVGD